METNELKSAVDSAVAPVMTAFEQFKDANDKRIAEIEKKGSADVLLTEKVDRIEKSLSDHEAINQKLTLLEQKAKAQDDLQKQFDEIELKIGRVIGKDRGHDEKKSRTNDWLRAVFNAHTVGIINLSQDEQKCLKEIGDEYKALNVGTDTAGGYLAPTEFVREIIKGVTEISPARSIVRVRTTVNKSIQIPKRTGQFSATWTAEQGTRSETTGLTYGQEEIQAHEMYALVDISNAMLEDSAFDMEGEIRMEAEEQFALAEGTAVVSGNGVGKPQGFLADSNVASTNSGAATAVAADGMITLFHAIKTAYSRNATWAFNRTTLGSIRKLKDTTNQYLWQPGLANGVPNTILGQPYVEMPDMPNEAANAYPVAFGDFRRGYTLVDRISMEMLRDPYTQATSGNVRFIFRRRLGGKVTLSEALRTLKCST